MQKHNINSPLKMWLKQNGIRQEYAALALHIPVSTLNRKLNGHVAWLDEDLRRINEIYGLSSDFVLGLKMPRHEAASRDRGLDHQQDCPSEIQSDSISSNLTMVEEDRLR